MISLRPTDTFCVISLKADGMPYSDGIFIISEGDEVPDGYIIKKVWITSHFVNKSVEHSHWYSPYHFMIEKDDSIVPQRISLLCTAKRGKPVKLAPGSGNPKCEPWEVIVAIEEAWKLSMEMSTEMVEFWRVIKEKSIALWR